MSGALDVPACNSSPTDGFYDPTTGQFLSRDPLNALTRSPYAYVYGNPLNMTDPTGLCGWTDPWDCVVPDDMSGIGQYVRPVINTGVDTVSRYRCVDDQKAAGFPVTAACEAHGVSTSGYYDWKNREAAGPTERQVADAQLIELMREIHAAGDGAYGVPRLWRELRRSGNVINKKKVQRLMRKAGLAGRCYRRAVRTTFPGPDGYEIPDPVGRRFAAGAPDIAWVQVITPTSRPVKGGCSSHRSSTWGPGGWSATRWPATPSWSSTP